MVKTTEEIARMANVLRLHVVEMTTEAGSGHPGGSLSAADLMAVLYFRVMKHDPKRPKWADRDRFILSKGHAAPILYSALAEAGYMPVEELKTLRKMGSRLQGHPVKDKIPGIEMSTGSLGQGLSMACGIALAGKMDGKDYRTFCLLGDGELQSGQNWEAAMFASHYCLRRLTVFVDRNRLQISGCTDNVMNIEPLADKWRAFGWNVMEADGHNIDAIIDACDKADKADRPSCVILDTVKGKGVSFMEDKVEFHGKSCDCEQNECAVREIMEAIEK
ncbi:MAG: transketolase [Thermoplasmatales archaeon]|jgi:transketolase|nr:transketolase [Thermoplasmatales archaeon]